MEAATKAVGGIGGETGRDDGSDLLGHLGAHQPDRLGRPSEPLHHRGARCWCVVRNTSGEHLVEHHTKREDVGAVVNRVAGDLRWREIRRRANHHARCGERTRVGGARDAEVGDEAAPGFGVDEYVGGLDFAVERTRSSRPPVTASGARCCELHEAASGHSRVAIREGRATPVRTITSFAPFRH